MERGVIRLFQGETKNDEGRTLAIAGPLVEIMARREAARLVEQRDGEPVVADLVFHNRGRRIVDYRRAWARAWMQNVGMNIADKRRLYREIARVLKPGGRYVFQEIAAGQMPTSHFPFPWATDPAESFLASAEQMRSLLEGCGFTAELFEDTSDTHLSRTIANVTPPVPGQLGLAVFVDDLVRKAANSRRSLEEGQIRLVIGVFRAG